MSEITRRPASFGCQREQFSLPRGLHYLNCAYMAPLPRRVEEAGLASMRRKRSPVEIVADDFFSLPAHTHELFATLIGAADPHRVAVLPAVSYGVAVVARNLEVAPSQNLVVVAEQFPSNLLAWRRLAKERGCELRVVDAPMIPRGERLAERLLTAIDSSTAAVAVGTVHWSDGTRLDLPAISERAKAAGAALVLDGTQSIGAAPFSVAEIEPDAVLCAGYKWLLGPYSVALGWFGPRFDGGRPLEETWMARVGSEDFRALVAYRDEYRPGAARYEVGERSNFILLPMLNAALELILEWGVDRIADRCRAITAPLFPRLRDWGFAVEDEAWRSPHLFGIRAPGALDLDKLQAALLARGVHVSLRGDAVRVAPHVYNDEADLAALADALGAARGAR